MTEEQGLMPFNTQQDDALMAFGRVIEDMLEAGIAAGLVMLECEYHLRKFKSLYPECFRVGAFDD